MSSGMAKTTYSKFIVITYPANHGNPKLQSYRVETPIPWDQARDRLIAAGVLKPELAGTTTSADGGWMLSVDPADFSEAKALPLPEAP